MRTPIRLEATPDGRANEDLTLAIAGIFGLPRSSVRLVAGERSRDKRFRLEASAAVVGRKLAEILP